MHPNVLARRLLLGGLLLAGLALPGAARASQEQLQTPPKPSANEPERPTGSIIVPIGGTVQLQMASKKTITNVVNEKPQVANVLPYANDPTKVSVSGIAAGTTRLRLTDAAGKVEIIEAVVQLDIDLLRNLLERAVPTASIKLIPVGQNNVILAGHVARAEDVDVIIRVAGSIVGAGPSQLINAMTVGGVQQVQLDVTVAQVNRSEIRRRGFNFVVNGTTVSLGSVLGGLTASTTNSTVTAPPGAVGIIPAPGLAVPISPPTGPNLVFGVIPAGFQGLLQALRDDSLAKILSEPKVVTLSGRPARFLAGGRQAVLSPASGINGPGVTFEDIGTEVDFLPVVLGNGKIYMEVLPRVRQVNNVLGINTTFGFVPGFDEQSVRTAVLMEADQTFAIGGLIQNISSASSSKIPILGDLPFVGAAFSTVIHTDQEQELVILITPHLVDPADCAQVPRRLPGRETRRPDDIELFLEGLLEAPRGPRHLFDGHHYKAAFKNDPSAGGFPCYDGANGNGNGCGASGCGNGGCGNGGCGAPAAPAGLAAPVSPLTPAVPSASATPMPSGLGLPAETLPRADDSPAGLGGRAATSPAQATRPSAAYPPTGP
jgi:pilus assembly protein CpaC